MAPLPVIDAACMRNGTQNECNAFGTKLLDSMVERGFAKLVNHSVPLPVVEDAFKMARKIFQLPLDMKKSTINDPSKGQQRGWSPPGEEKTWWLESNTGNVDSPRFSDNKESFDCGIPNDQQFPNKWPPEEALPGCQATMDKFFSDCGKLCIDILEVLASQMHHDPNLFSSRCTNEASTIRINHFPSVSRETLESNQVSRIWPHTDFGIISLVFPSELGGLEYEDRENPGTFIPMPYNRDEEVIVLISETFQRWTNGNVGACMHRVTKPIDMAGDTVPERWSLVYFCKADRHINVGPLKEFIGQERQPLYEDLTALQYQSIRNSVHYPNTVPETVAANS